MVKGSGGSGRGGGVALSKSARADIKTLESKGYNVRAYPYTFMGEPVKAKPVAYEISVVNENGTRITLDEDADDYRLKWNAENKRPIKTPSKTRTQPTETVAQQRQRIAKAREWDRLYNEGGEGFNPYR